MKPRMRGMDTNVSRGAKPWAAPDIAMVVEVELNLVLLIYHRSIQVRPHLDRPRAIRKFPFDIGDQFYPYPRPIRDRDKPFHLL